MGVRGRYMPSTSVSPQTGLVGVWGEWEANTQFQFTGNTNCGFPKYVHTPIKPTDPGSDELQNTDPCIFGGPFLYSNCHQLGRKNRYYTTQLERGDLILFGSKVRHENRFVLDTVFVVRDRIPYRKLTARQDEAFRKNVPPWFFHLTIDRIPDDTELVLYVGATPEMPVSGMFSFAPCVVGAESTINRGFQRPSVASPYLNPVASNGDDGINPSLTRMFKHLKGKDPFTAWKAITRELTSGPNPLALGVSFEVE